MDTDNQEVHNAMVSSILELDIEQVKRITATCKKRMKEAIDSHTTRDDASVIHALAYRMLAEVMIEKIESEAHQGGL